MGQLVFRWPCVAVVAVLCLLVEQAPGQTDVCIRVPKKTADCLLSSKYHPVPKDSVTQACLQELFWDFSSPQNVTADDTAYFKRLSRQYLDSLVAPSSGFRQRREYRQLSAGERENLHRAFQILYDEGTIHRFGKLYRHGYRVVRQSPAFLGFQRIFLIAFEEQLRRIDDTVSLPYWDFTIDTEMDNPVNSLLWSQQFFGNGNGRIRTGDFRDWRSPKGPLQRRYGESNYGQLINRDVVRNIVSKCRSRDITYPIQSEADEKFILEFHHNGVMNWLGGSSSDAATAAYDPVFYMLSACTDYIWWVFRRTQQYHCGINPSLDYPVDGKRQNQGAFDKMVGFSDFTNADGYSNYWTTYWYNYTIAQGCPDCNSEYLWCDRSSFRCVAHSRRHDFNIGRYSVPTTDVFEPATEYVPHRIERPVMPSPFNDGRTMATARRDAQTTIARQQSLISRRNEILVLNALDGSDLLEKSSPGNVDS